MATVRRVFGWLMLPLCLLAGAALAFAGIMALSCVLSWLGLL